MSASPSIKPLTEKQITAALLGHWRSRGAPRTLVASVPNAGAHGQAGLHRGVFDLIVISPRLPCAFLELKTAKGKLSAEQTAFQNLCIANGVPCAVAYGLDEAIKALEYWLVIKPEAKQ